MHVLWYQLSCSLRHQHCLIFYRSNVNVCVSVWLEGFRVFSQLLLTDQEKQKHFTLVFLWSAGVPRTLWLNASSADPGPASIDPAELSERVWSWAQISSRCREPSLFLRKKQTRLCDTKVSSSRMFAALSRTPAAGRCVRGWDLLLKWSGVALLQRKLCETFGERRALVFECICRSWWDAAG